MSTNGTKKVQRELQSRAEAMERISATSEAPVSFFLFEPTRLRVETRLDQVVASWCNKEPNRQSSSATFNSAVLVTKLPNLSNSGSDSDSYSSSS